MPFAEDLDRKVYKTKRMILDMKRGAIITLLFISIFLLSVIAGCGSTSSSGSASPSSSASNDDTRFSSRNGVYSGSITFTADEVFSRPRANSINGATGATEHVSTTINFSNYRVGADGWSQSWEVPVSGTYDYSCATTGNYVRKYEDSSPSSSSSSGYADAEPKMDANKGLENGVTLLFDSDAGGRVVESYTDWCEDANGAGLLIHHVIQDIFSNYYGNTDKLAIVGVGYPTYFFNKDGETVSFGRTFEVSKDPDYPQTITYSGTVTVVRDK